MTSLELVDFINAHREEAAATSEKGYVKLQHKHFLAKVPEVLGVETSAKFLADLPDTYGRLQPAYRFPKREACLMAMSYSYDIQAKVFDRMTALENRLRVGPSFQPTTAIEQDLRVVGILADMLRVAPSGRITMAGFVLKQSAPHLLPILPSYAVDAPPSAIAAGSSLPTASASELLKRHEVAMSALKFNEKLHANGLLEQQYRSSRGNNKRFWSVTDKGSEWGKNITNSANARETQPHWYVERFSDLLRFCEID